MAEQLINELEKAAHVLLAPPNLFSAEQRLLAEQVFLNFQRTNSPYQLCQQILETNKNNFILLETTALIKIALMREWTTLPQEDISSLRQYLLHYVISKPDLVYYVRVRILEVIAIIIMKGSIYDSGQERRQVLGEVENVIMAGDLPRKVVGLNLISAIMQEYEKESSYDDDVNRIFRFCVGILDELVKKDMQENTMTMLEHLLPIIESIFTSTFFSLSHMESVVKSVYDTRSNPASKLNNDCQNVILDPSLLDLFFTLYCKIRNNLQLANYARTCLVQLANLKGAELLPEETKLQYLSNYMQRFLKFITCIDIIDQEASGIASIMKNLTCFHKNFNSLPKEMLKLFADQLSRLTCLFIENSAKEESLCADECLYTEALDTLLAAWIHTLSQTELFPHEFCKQSAVQIFNIYLQCHLSAPEGTRNMEEKDLDKIEIGVEEDDKVRFKAQLETIGSIGRQVLSHSLPLLAQLIEDRTSKLRESLNKFAEQIESLNTASNSMTRLYEDIHWLLLITGHVLYTESEGDIPYIIPSEIVGYNMEQVQQGKVDINLTLQFLTSSENISSDMIVATESVDHVIRLVADIFRLCAIEKTVISIHLDSIWSPELSCTITWILRRWSVNYLMSMQYRFSEIRTTFIQVFGEDTPSALWTMNFLLGKIECNINAFKSEPVLMEETIQLLISLVSSRKKASYVFKCERFPYIMNLAVKGQCNLPQTVKRGLMRAVTQVGNAVQKTEQTYWSQALQSVQHQCKQVISNGKLLQTYHQEETKIQIINILEGFIGAALGMQFSESGSLFPYLYPLLRELPNLLSLYHNYQEIIQLILEFLCASTKVSILSCCTQTEATQMYEICLNTIQNYSRCNINRLTVESTAEEDSYQDILLLIRLLSNIVLTSIPVDAFLCGFDILMPMITMNLLQFPSLCLHYFKMIQYFCQNYPEKVYSLPSELLQPLLNSIELGLHTFGYEVSVLCCNIIEIIAKSIFNDISSGRPRNQLIAPFLNTLITVTLLHPVDADFITNMSIPFYYLIRCYREEYQQIVQNILSSQTDQQVAQKLANAFTKLTENIKFDSERSSEQAFKNNFNQLVTNVHSFLMVK